MPHDSQRAQKWKRSRNGCHPCKNAKIKCDETKPECLNCVKNSRTCDYSMKLTWGGRPYKKPKIEKLNPVANMSQTVLSRETQITKDSVKKENTQLVLIQEAPHIKKSTSSTRNSAEPEPEPELVIKQEMQDFPQLPSQVSSNENSNWNSQTPVPDIAQSSMQECFSLPYQSPPDPNFQDQLSSHLFDSVSNNIRSVNDVLGTLLNDRLEQSGPAFILEHLSSQSVTADEVPPQLLQSDLHQHREFDDIVDEYSDDIEKLRSFFPPSPSGIQSTPFISQRHKGSTRPARVHEIDDEALEFVKRESGLDEEHMSLTKRSHSTLSTSSSSSIELIESIPRGILPLPDMLRKIPEYYDSYTFFLNSTSRVFAPFDESIAHYNPFQSLVPQLALSNDGLLTVLVAYGLSHRSFLLNKKEPGEIIDQLLSRSLSELLILLQNKETATSDLTLTLILLISSFMVFSLKHNWKIHMRGATQILLMRGYNKPFSRLLKEVDLHPRETINKKITESKLLFFLLRWYAYFDVLASLSSPLNPTQEEISSNSVVHGSLDESGQIDYEIDPANDSDNENDTQPSLIRDESYVSVDYMLGFNIKFLPLFKETVKLIRNTNLQLATNPTASASPATVEKVLHLVSCFHRLDSVHLLKSSSSSEAVITVVAMNRLFLIMGLNQLYRRVLRIARSSALIQDLCMEAHEIVVKHVRGNSLNELSLLMPLFVTGCDCDDSFGRLTFYKKLVTFAEKGSPSADKALEIMKKCWETSGDWWDVTQQETKGIIFW